jgi:Zn-finger nucleic acid-binding protein
MNVPDNDFCAGCGQNLGLEPVALPSQLNCPECGTQFSSFDGDPGLLHDCPSCGGQFVEHTLLHELLERRRRFHRATASVKPRNPSQFPVRYVPCPVCGDMMNRRNFGKTSGVIVDVCARDGTWFEPGELPRVLAFVEAGGLADARRQQLGIARPRNTQQERAAARAVAAKMREDDERRRRDEASRAPPKPGEVAVGVLESSLEVLETIGNWLLRER